MVCWTVNVQLQGQRVKDHTFVRWSEHVACICMWRWSWMLNRWQAPRENVAGRTENTSLGTGRTGLPLSGRVWESGRFEWSQLLEVSIRKVLRPATSAQVFLGFAVSKRMLRWFPRLQVATACFSCSPPDLNLLDPYFIFMLCLFHIYVHA